MNSENPQPVHFRAVLIQEGKTATGITVPEEVVAALGSSKRPAVLATINGYTYRSSVAVYKGEYKLPVSEEHRKGAGIAAGDEVEVSLALDTAPREAEVPADLAGALEQEPEARRFFEGLSYSNKRRITLPIEDAKTPETRQRRVEKAITQLREGKI